MGEQDESLSGCGDGGAVSMKGEEKSVGMDKREDGKCWKFPWWSEVSESETELELEPEPEEEEQKLIAVMNPCGEGVEFLANPRLLSDTEIGLHQLHLYGNDRKKIPPGLAPFLWRYRLEQELKDKPLSIDLFPITVPDYDASSDFDSSSEEEEEEAKAPEPATPTHEGKTPRDGKRSQSRDGNSSSRDGKRSRRHRKRDRSRNDPTDQHQRRYHRH